MSYYKGFKHDKLTTLILIHSKRYTHNIPSSMELHPSDNIVERNFVLLFFKCTTDSKTLTPKIFRNKSCACS